jgi:hypothetical protein
MQSIPRVFGPLSSLLLALFAAGCAMTPESRTLDTAGVDPARYNSDLYQCKLFASNYGWEQGIEKSGNVLGGGLIGGAIAVATGGVFSPNLADAMVVGSMVGAVVNIANAANDKVTKKEPIVGESAKFLVTDCMRDKGYRVVLGTTPLNANGGNLPTYLVTASGLAQNQSPRLGVPPPLQSSPVQPAATSSPVVAAPRASPPADSQAGPAPTQRYRLQAERLATQRACVVPVTALQAAKGATFETYTTTCSNGGALAIHCERGKCKVLAK